MRAYLRQLRMEFGMTQQDVADCIGVSKQYYGMIENGERKQKMDIEMATKLAKLFDVPLEIIVTREQELRLQTEEATA